MTISHESGNNSSIPPEQPGKNLNIQEQQQQSYQQAWQNALSAPAIPTSARPQGQNSWSQPQTNQRSGNSGDWNGPPASFEVPGWGAPAKPANEPIAAPGAFGRSEQREALNGPALAYQPPQEPPASPIRSSDRGRNQRRKIGFFAGLALVLLTLIVVGTGFLMHLSNNPASSDGSLGTVVVPTGPLGSFISAPLTPAQINQLRHLTSRMTTKQLASLYVSHMSLDEKLGQLITVEYNQPAYSSDLDYMINTLHAGGVIMYEFQMNTFNQTKNDIAHMQQRSKIPLLISTDEEGGPYVHRLKSIYGLRPSAWDIYQRGSVDYARQMGHKMAHDLLALGINVDLAPDVDIMLVPGYDTVTRTFGTTADSVIKYAGPFMEAMQGDGLIATVKHFPGGLGSTVLDAHKTLPTVNRSKAQINAVELAPYRDFISSPNKLLNPGIVMPTDILMPSIDPNLPAELSPAFMTGILRNQLGYDGVVMTDALYMQGIAERWSQPVAAVMALNAGNDIILGPNGTGQTLAVINGLKAALQDGRLSMTRVNEAVSRILALKVQYHLMPALGPQN